jgi:hypothetical protein
MSIKTIIMSNTKNVAAVPGMPATEQKTKPELSKIVVPAKVQSPSKNVDEIKRRVEDYTALLEKHSLLQESKKKLDSFSYGSDEHSQNLRLQDKEGNNFSTGNPVVVREVIELIRKQLNTQCGVVENDVLNFII